MCRDDALVFGFAAGVILTVICSLWSHQDIYDKVGNINELIEECQKELKRTESCVIVAVPEVTKGD